MSAWVAASVGCGPADGLEGDEDEVGAARAELALAPCEGRKEAEGRLAYENIEVELVGEECLDEVDERGRSIHRKRWVDRATGLAMDLVETDRLDAVALKYTHHAMAPDLRRQLEKVSDGAALKAHVWLRVQDADLPSRSERAFSEDVAEWATAHIRSSIGAGARRVHDEIDALRKTGVAVQADSKWGNADPFVPVTASRAALERLGDLEEVALIMPDPGEEKPAGSPYFDIDVAGFQEAANFDGTGLRVAILESNRPDSRVQLPGAMNGSGSNSCTVTGGTVLCYCPGSPLVAFHPRQVAGVLRSPAAHMGGMADDVQVNFANYGGSCVEGIMGATSFSSATNWARLNAEVLNRSASNTDFGSPQNNVDRFLDWTANQEGWPLIVTTAGNDGNTLRVANNLMNGLVVGGGDDHGANDRAGVTLSQADFRAQGKGHCLSQGANYNAGAGAELPHIVAPCVKVATAAAANGSVVEATGTSFAAPQIAGIAASLIEQNTNLSEWWELLVVGLLVGANENIDEAQGGEWPLDTMASFDDFDGVGLVNAWLPMFVLDATSKRDGGNSPVAFGHDFGGISASSTPAGQYYSESYYATLAPGQRLIAASIIAAQPSCNGGEATCAQSPFPRTSLELFRDGVFSGKSDRVTQNYQYRTWFNSTGTSQNMRIRLKVPSWNGVATTTFGIAWLIH